MADIVQYLTLGLDDDIFGIEITNVREILDMRPISKLPQAPDFLVGMIDVRGAGYPIVDLRTKLGLPRVAQTPSTRIVILDVPLAGRTIGVGFIADRVFEVAGIDQEQTEPAPEVGGRWRSHYIASIARKGDDFIIIFDLARLMASDEAALVDGTAAAISAMA